MLCVKPVVRMFLEDSVRRDITPEVSVTTAIVYNIQNPNCVFENNALRRCHIVKLTSTSQPCLAAENI